jgi:hypothetical protein
MFRAKPNGVKLKKSSFFWKVSTGRRGLLCGSTPYAKRVACGRGEGAGFIVV